MAALSTSARPSWRIAVAAALAVAASMAWVPGSARAEPVALGVSTHRAPNEDRSLDSFSILAGRRPLLTLWFQAWSEPLFYAEQIRRAHRRGAVPMVTWEPVRRGARITLRSIARGRHDRYLRASARSARRWGRPFFVRFAHEMNGNWYSWGSGVNGNTAARYIAAWRHVVRIFRRAGASNVRWVWSPNVYGNNGARAFAPLYPGNRWVDWVALDGYNWGPLRTSGWVGFGDLFGPSYDAMTRLTRKPLMIAETATSEHGGDKAAWIRDALEVTLPTRFPRVRALVWFDREKETDWSVTSSPAALLAFGAAVRSPVFAASRRALLRRR